MAFWGTRLFLGEYYKTYGVGSDSVETAVSADVVLLYCNTADRPLRCGKCSIILISSIKTALDRVRKSLTLLTPARSVQFD